MKYNIILHPKQNKIITLNLLASPISSFPATMTEISNPASVYVPCEAIIESGGPARCLSVSSLCLWVISPTKGDEHGRDSPVGALAQRRRMPRMMNRCSDWFHSRKG